MGSMRWSVMGGICLAAVAATSSMGCDVIEKFTKQMQEAADKAEKANNPPANPDEELGLKLNNHIECINHTSGMVMRARSRYLSWIDDAEKGPSGKERNVFGLYAVTESIVKRCTDALDKADGMEPETEDLDKIAKKYHKALDKVVPLVEDAYKYYNQQDYKDDAFKKGKEMHKPLIEAWEEFDEADQKLRGQIAELKDGMAERELEFIEKNEGKNLYWYSRKLNISARHLVEVADVDIDELDVETLQGVIKDYEGDLAKMQKALSKEPKDGIPMMFSSYEGDANDLLKAAKSLMRRKRDKTEFSQGDIMMMNGGNPQMVDGHPAQVVDKFNDFINTSNNLSW